MVCKMCGQVISDHSVVCPYCGAQVQEPKQNNVGVQQNNVSVQPTPNTIAIVGFVLAFFASLPGLICSIIGYKKAINEGADHKKLALAGIIISAVSIVLSIILGIVYGAIIGALIAEMGSSSLSIV